MSNQPKNLNGADLIDRIDKDEVRDTIDTEIEGVVFFGTSALSIHIINVLLDRGIKPAAIVTVPDRPSGRKMIMTPPPLKVWASEHNIPCFQFEKLDQNAGDILSKIAHNSSRPNLFIVASYGKIIPQNILDIPVHGALNVHPSLLPKLRGATPLQTSIMQDMQDTGVSIIKMDKEMDHGPIVAMFQEKVKPWPQTYTELEQYLAIKGAEILVKALPDYMSGKLIPTEQKHEEATFTKKIEKSDGLIVISDLSGFITGKDAWSTFLKHNALIEWPGLYFFINKNKVTQEVNTSDTEANETCEIRVKIKDASWNTALEHMEILRVIPEGKKEMTWKDFENYIKG